jgi:hypothetical protein
VKRQLLYTSAKLAKLREEQLAELVDAQRRDHASRDPIRLGGQAARDAKTDVVLSLEKLGDMPSVTRAATVQLEQWQTVLRAAGFTDQERLYVSLRWLDRLSPRALRDQTGWSRAEVEKLRNAIHSRMVEMRQRKRLSVGEYWDTLTSAYGHVYRETLPSGHRTYSMRLPEPFPILNNSKQICLEDPVFSGGKSVRPPLTTEGEIQRMLEARLQEAKLLRGRIWTQRQDAASAVDQADATLQAARKLLAAEEENAIIEERKAAPIAVERVTAAEEALQKVTRHFSALDRAYVKQGDTIEAITGEIEGRRRERAMAKLVEPRKRLIAAINELKSVALEVRAIGIEAGPYGLPLFESLDPSDPLARCTGRMLYAQVYRLALEIVREETMFGGRKAVA